MYSEPSQEELFPRSNARIFLADGRMAEGYGVGSRGTVFGEICFNTSMTGYQEALTDPSYQGQILTFTFPHIGNVGVNAQDCESALGGALGVVLRAPITKSFNHRAQENFDLWLQKRGIVGICGVDTRALTTHIRDAGMQNAVIQFLDPAAPQPAEDVRKTLQNFPEMTGRNLVQEVSCAAPTTMRSETLAASSVAPAAQKRVVVVDYGVKLSILDRLAARGGQITRVPPNVDASVVFDAFPDGVLLSNGPGDPMALSDDYVKLVQTLIESKIPIFGICFGHQMLARALNLPVKKMLHGHHGVNHPVQERETGKVIIVSMNHGFTVDRVDFPSNVKETYVSLFDGVNCGLAFADRPVFSVQFHPEASPGPHDAEPLFDAFMAAMGGGRAHLP